MNWPTFRTANQVEHVQKSARSIKEFDSTTLKTSAQRLKIVDENFNQMAEDALVPGKRLVQKRYRKKNQQLRQSEKKKAQLQRSEERLAPTDSSNTMVLNSQKIKQMVMRKPGLHFKSNTSHSGMSHKEFIKSVVKPTDLTRLERMMMTKVC